MSSLPFDYTFDGLDFEGVIVAADEDAPTVLVFHGIEGRSDAQVDICHRLAGAGYRAVASGQQSRTTTGPLRRAHLKPTEAETDRGRSAPVHPR